MLCEVIFLLGCFVTAAVASECPSVCYCFSDIYFCQTGGLTQLPSHVPPGTGRVHLAHHQFASPILRQSNMTAFANSRIERFWLRNCSIEMIEAQAFVGLRDSLTLLDLSSNHLTQLAPRTFAGLKLSNLNLNNNRGLLLDANSFVGLKVDVLTLNGCDLKELSVDVFRPVLGVMNDLKVKDNQITQLEEEFSQVIQQVESIDFSANPFQCDCKLRWMSRILTWKMESSKIDRNLFPVCAGPAHLKHRLIHHINASEWYCDPPVLRLLEVHYITAEEAILACSATGSPHLKVHWIAVPPTPSSAVQLLPGNASFAYARLQLGASRLGPWWIHCQAEDYQGVVTAKVLLNMPRPSSAPGVLLGEGNSSLSPAWSPSLLDKDHENDFLLGANFTLLQLLITIGVTFLVTLCLCTAVYCAWTASLSLSCSASPLSCSVDRRKRRRFHYQQEKENAKMCSPPNQAGGGRAIVDLSHTPSSSSTSHHPPLKASSNNASFSQSSSLCFAKENGGILMEGGGQGILTIPPPPPPPLPSLPPPPRPYSVVYESGASDNTYDMPSHHHLVANPNHFYPCAPYSSHPLPMNNNEFSSSASPPLTRRDESRLLTSSSPLTPNKVGNPAEAARGGTLKMTNHKLLGSRPAPHPDVYIDYRTQKWLHGQE